MKKIFKKTAMKALLVAGTLLLTCCGNNSEKEEENEGRIIKAIAFEEEVSYTRDDEEQSVYENMNFQPGDNVVTDETGRLSVKIDDDKYLYMYENTDVTMKYSGDEEDGITRIVLNEGTILNVLEESLSEDASYEVKTSNATIGVRGTEFFVQYDDELTTVYCRDGEVRIEAEDNEVEIGAGEVAIVEEEEAVLLEEEDAQEVIDGFEAIADDDAGDGENAISGLLGEEQGERIIDLTNTDVGDEVIFGYYEQDNDLTNGSEPVEWIVLDNQGDRILVLSKKVFLHNNELRPDVNVTAGPWEDSYIRAYLNSEFMDNVFTSSEQDRILETTVINDNSDGVEFCEGYLEQARIVNTVATDLWHDLEYCYKGRSTNDKVFLLSAGEAIRYFDVTYKENFGQAYKSWQSDELCATPTEYTAATGMIIYTMENPAGFHMSESYEGNTLWSLRSRGGATYDKDLNYSYSYCYVGPDGVILNGGGGYSYLRPAMWITLE